MKKRVAFTVSFTQPPAANIGDARRYILDAVACYHGSLKPPDRDPEDPEGDPMFELDGDSVRVVRVGDHFSLGFLQRLKARLNDCIELLETDEHDGHTVAAAIASLQEIVKTV